MKIRGSSTPCKLQRIQDFRRVSLFFKNGENDNDVPLTFIRFPTQIPMQIKYGYQGELYIRIFFII